MHTSQVYLFDPLCVLILYMTHAIRLHVTICSYLDFCICRMSIAMQGHVFCLSIARGLQRGDALDTHSHTVTHTHASRLMYCSGCCNRSSPSQATGPAQAAVSGWAFTRECIPLTRFTRPLNTAPMETPRASKPPKMDTTTAETLEIYCNRSWRSPTKV